MVLWCPGHQEGVRCRKETALEEQQSLSFKVLRSFLLRWMQGIRYLRTDGPFVHSVHARGVIPTPHTHRNTNCSMTSSQKRLIRVLKRASDTVPS